MKKVVLTGGAGFIGSHLAEELVGRDYQIVILDDLSTGKVENIKDLLEGNSVELVQGSVTDLPLLNKVFQGAHFVFHLAAIASVPRSIDNPQTTHEVNVGGTLNVLLASRENGVKKVIYASSCSVYGDTALLPQKEDMPLQPLSPYAVTKLSGEYYCRVFQRVYELPVACLRYFNVYGPRQDPDSQYAAVIPRFIKRALNGEPPVIFGDGEQTRDFTFVKDAVSANILAAESGASGVFNIASGRSVSINRLARLIMELTGSQAHPAYQEPRAGDIRHSLADISHAKTFGYAPRYSLEEGLKATIGWFRGDSSTL